MTSGAESREHEPLGLLPFGHPGVDPTDVVMLSGGPIEGALDPFVIARTGTRSRDVLARETAATMCDNLVHDRRNGRLYRHLLDEAVTAVFHTERDGHVAGSMHAVHAVIRRWAGGAHTGLDTDDAPAQTWTALARTVDDRLAEVRRGPVGALLFRRT